MTTDTPLISIVLPTYNRLRFLQEAVESVLSQTYMDWELIIIDDGSTDHTRSYLPTLHDERINSIFRPHTGSIAALRNRGISESKGDYVAFLDSDDVWFPEKLERQVSAFQDCPGSGWGYTRCQLIDEHGHDLPEGASGAWQPVSGFILEKLLTTSVVVPTPTVMAKRALLESVGGFDESLRLAEDYDLWIRLAMRSPACAIMEATTKIRLHGGRTTSVGPQIHAANARVYAKTAAATKDPSIRAVCRTLRVHHMAACAREHSIRGAWWSALTTLLRSAPYGLTAREWWVQLLKVLLRPAMRRNLRAWYHESKKA